LRPCYNGPARPLKRNNLRQCYNGPARPLKRMTLDEERFVYFAGTCGHTTIPVCDCRMQKMN